LRPPLRVGELAAGATGPPTNLPPDWTSFVGRRREIAEIKDLLINARLLTLTGAGGAGKTRLALHLGRELLPSFEGGVWLVELAPLAEPDLVPQAVAAALGVSEKPGLPLLEAVAAGAAPRQVLLVLDNCEHLLDACATLVEALLEVCPRLHILATSRQGLRAAGERVWRVPSLSVPDQDSAPTPERLLDFEAVRLFVERAVAVRPTFRLTSDNAAAVVEVCRRLDGIPLALELAAGRLSVLTVEQIAIRLENRFRLLTGGGRHALPRQQTLRALIDWSHELLSDAERALLRRLAVFAAGYTLDAVEAVCSGSGIQAEDVLDLLDQLIDKSLVLTEEVAGGEMRYSMPETIRAYAAEKLDAAGEATEVRQRHRDWYFELALRAEPELRGANQGVWLGRLEREHDNLRAALRCPADASDADIGLRVTWALSRFWFLRGHLAEGQRWLEAAIAQGEGGSPEARAQALNAAATFAGRRGDYGRAAALLEASLALQQALGDRAGSAKVLGNLGIVAQEQGDLPSAAARYARSLALYTELDDRAGMAIALNNLGEVRREQGDLVTAEQLHDQALRLFREVGDDVGVALSLSNLGEVARRQGDHAGAGRLWRESLAVFARLGERIGMAECLERLGVAAHAAGQSERAARLLAGAACLRAAVDAPLPPADQAHIQRVLTEARVRLGEATFARVWEAARDRELADLLAEAAAPGPGGIGTESAPAAGGPAGPLTAREQEVAALVARGMTNKEIAAELVIAPGTVRIHVERILGKLDFRSRAQVAAWAVERGLGSRP
jgi:non-specific serine/threonine protein kinase